MFYFTEETDLKKLRLKNLKIVANNILIWDDEILVRNAEIKQSNY
jgi:hypothetical protein